LEPNRGGSGYEQKKGKFVDQSKFSYFFLFIKPLPVSSFPVAQPLGKRRDREEEREGETGARINF